MRPRGITRGNAAAATRALDDDTAGFNEAAGYYPRKHGSELIIFEKDSALQ